MGLGRYKNGKFDLILSLRHNADATRIGQWERSFRRASEILFDATDGQMQFGKLYVANNSIGGTEADAWLLPDEGTSSSFVNALGIPGLHMNLKSDEKNKPFVVIHEFGHYGFGLYDEYIGPSGSAECTGTTSGGACIMEHGYWNGDQIADDGTLTPGPVNEFCVEDNHDPDSDTDQESIHGEPCWNTIHTNFPDVAIPDGLPGGPVPGGHEDVDWILLAEDPRFVLLLDKSGSMSAGNGISGVRFGADYWTQYLATSGDSLSIIAYNHGQDVILPLTSLDATTDLGSTLTAIGSITPGGTTNVGGALDSGLMQILSPGDRAATQVAILFSDGLHNTGTPPESVVDDLVENGVRVYTIGFGPYADQARLEQIADDTGGRFEFIDADPDSDAGQLEIQNYLIEISGEVRDGSGIVTMMPGLLPEPAASEFAAVKDVVRLKGSSKTTLAAVGKIPLAFRVRSTGFDHRAYIESGSDRATFVVSHKEGTAVNFFLTAPDGTLVNPQTDTDVTLVNPTYAPYAFYVVRKPASGFWTMRVTRGQATGAIPFKIFAFSENRDIAFGINGINRAYRVMDTIKLQSQVVFKTPLTALRSPIASIDLKPPGTKTLTVGRLGLLKGAQTVVLKERTVKTPVSGNASRSLARVANGVYENVLQFDEPGSYSVTLKMVNQGKATEAEAEAERKRDGESEPAREPAPMFIRTKRFQIHVGPLPEGKDVESGDQSPSGSGSSSITKQGTILKTSQISKASVGSGGFHVDIGLELRPSEESSG
ncbi:vWA domain-containing protein [Desulfosarcina ovata]|uniref:VWFA domain-containing protein n=1 Tax=Desulfosarcina ovata subsp. ovata TaxID=2752305 RepID=A0A5K8A9V1_9BACT|nr:vWA domain-containing protein [Desulfosarcina ovata]BBO89483.1 hypothetical protein DSCOOX_26630 [Desulfosarcina ovata subsp. ovata]